MANRTQNKARAVGGRLYVTNHRVLFCPHAVDAALEGQYWGVYLADIAEVGREKKSFSLSGCFNGSLRDRLRIITPDGSTSLFVINKLDNVIEEIRAAAAGSR